MSEFGLQRMLLQGILGWIITVIQGAIWGYIGVTVVSIRRNEEGNHQVQNSLLGPVVGVLIFTNVKMLGVCKGPAILKTSICNLYSETKKKVGASSRRAEPDEASGSRDRNLDLPHTFGKRGGGLHK